MKQAGIFGQTPTNGGYVSHHGPGGSLGFTAGEQQLYLDPPFYDDGGIRRIQPSSKPAFWWSVDTTTNTDPNQGAKMVSLSPPHIDTHVLEVVSGTGDSWMNTFLAGGYAILFMSPSAETLSNVLSFVVTKDPSYIAEHASSDGELMVLIDGPEPIVQAAKTIAQQGKPGSPPVPPIPGGAPPATDTGCGPGKIGIPPFCVGLPGATPEIPELPGLPSKPPGPSVPPPAPPPVAPPVAPIPAAKTKAPDWLLSTLVGVGALSVFALVARKRKARS